MSEIDAAELARLREVAQAALDVTQTYETLDPEDIRLQIFGLTFLPSLVLSLLDALEKARVMGTAWEQTARNVATERDAARLVCDAVHCELADVRTERDYARAAYEELVTRRNPEGSVSLQWIWPDPRGSFDGPVVVGKYSGTIVYMSHVVMPSAWDANR